MNLFLYSGGAAVENRMLDDKLMKMLPKNPQMTFIPASSYMCEHDFRDFVKQYKRYRVKKFINFPLDHSSSNLLRRSAFESDVIHLSGGNTFYFLAQLRKNKMMSDLRDFVHRGGVLTGLSAGAILMTKSIHTAAFPYFDRDENYDNIKNLNALNLVDFEFFPHYKHSNRYKNEMINYSMANPRPLYACYDGGGVCVTEEGLSIVGKAYCYHRGEFFKVSGHVK